MHEKWNLNGFYKATHNAVNELRKWPTKTATLVHHDDGDGLCSAAVTREALEREGFRVKNFCLEKVYPEVIKSLHGGVGQIIFYADIGSSHADFISESNTSRNLTIILDHHDPRPVKDPRVYDVNLEHHGFRGERDFSGATSCYLFAKVLNERNVDLSYLALVGSCEIPDGLAGLNKVVLDEAIRNGVVRVKGKKIEIVKLGVRIDDLFSKLQILGAVGYYEGGPELGIRACLEGISDQVKEKIDEWEGRRKRANGRLLARLFRERLKETDHIQWFDAGDVYSGMGTKVIGQFCSFLSYQRRLIKPDKYILGFTRMSPEIPGYGRLREEYVKASLRVPREMSNLIDSGKMPSAVDLLVEASDGFGVADGHAFAASCVLSASMTHILIENAEKVIRSSRG